MKQILAFLSSAIILLSCGGKSKTTGTTNNNDNAKTTGVNPAMQGFMNKLDGKAAHTGDALKQYGKDSLATADMEMYDLKEPEIMETNGNCYLLRCKSGITLRKYNICWEGDKIVSVEDKGME